MLSTCPSCLSQVSHAEHLFDVTCECGTHFSPFLNQGESGELVSLSEHGSGAGPNADLNSFSEYGESSAAFADIRNFGEGIHSDALNPSSPTPPSTSPAVDASNVKSTDTSSALHPGGFLIVTGDSLQGYKIDSYLSPISIWAPLDSSNENPMKQAFSALWELALRCGGSAVLGLDWKLSPDGTRVLLSGIPVRCSKAL